jgi:hypothetical protein
MRVGVARAHAGQATGMRRSCASVGKLNELGGRCFEGPMTAWTRLHRHAGDDRQQTATMGVL